MKRNERTLLLLTISLAMTACGHAEEETIARFEVSLRQHQLACDVPTLQAKLEVTGRSEDCPLTVNTADRTISGTCPSVPTGAVLEFSLLYYVPFEGPTEPIVELARAYQSLDLTEVDEAQVVLAFADDSLNIDFDDDRDGQTNLAEVCQMKNPRGQ